GKKISQVPFPILTYKEAIGKHGTDRPDLRADKENNNELAFCFVVDFPAFTWSKEGKRWEAEHNPFSGVQTEDPKEVTKNPGKVLSWQYDLALNGQEIGGGSIRSSNPEMLRASFEVMGYEKEEIEKQFGHMLEAFTYGVPPHGGYGGGVDRLLAILLGESSIREVMAFPKTGDNRELMMGTPSEVSQAQLDELHLKIQKPKKQ
ncbi:MAG: amino acid--tRNA ligase-related protein, partial [Candidatus Pacearchaeota archaeon]|nr:amino acid--tRNA ligase-related protein [Candidatus Pacearchaeota archaeon]